MLQHFSFHEQNLVCSEGKDSACPAGEAMSTKRKAESHSTTASRPRIIKSRGPQVDSERDSGFSGLKGSHWIHGYKTKKKHQIKAKLLFLDASSEQMSIIDTADSEDLPCAAVQQGLKPSGSGQSSQLAVVGGSYSNLSPMIIMNNVLLKQVHRRCTTPPWLCSVNLWRVLSVDGHTRPCLVGFFFNIFLYL